MSKRLPSGAGGGQQRGDQTKKALLSRETFKLPHCKCRSGVGIQGRVNTSGNFGLFYKVGMGG